MTIEDISIVLRIVLERIKAKNEMGDYRRDTRNKCKNSLSIM